MMLIIEVTTHTGDQMSLISKSKQSEIIGDIVSRTTESDTNTRSEKAKIIRSYFTTSIGRKGTDGRDDSIVSDRTGYKDF